jgi:plastocyanin
MNAYNMPVHQTQGRRSRPWLWIVLGVVLAWLVLGRGAGLLFGGDDGPAPNPAASGAVSGVPEVAVRDNVFEPAALEVPAGTTVTWNWEGDTHHNVVGDGFESPVQESGNFSYTFNTPGTHDYECTLHGGMRGQVIVTEASA